MMLNNALTLTKEETTPVAVPAIVVACPRDASLGTSPTNDTIDATAVPCTQQVGQEVGEEVGFLRKILFAW